MYVARVGVIVAIFLASLFTGRAEAQSAGSCESVFQYGVYDAYALNRSSYSLEAFHNAMCNGVVRQSSGGNSSGGGGTVSIEIPGLFGIGLGGNYQQAQQFQEYYKRTFCQTGSEIRIDHVHLQNFVNIVSPTMVDAYKACVSARSKGLGVIVQRTTENVVTFGITFDQPNSTAVYKVVYVEPPTAASCRTPSLKPDTKLDGTTHSITCARTSNSLSEFTIAIHTTAGVFSYLMPSKPSPTTPAPLPIGSVVAFTGPQEPAGWKLCDGQKLNVDDYPELFRVLNYSFGGDATTRKFALPDLQGRFVRGLGEKGRVIGSFQDWSTGLPKVGWSVTRDGGHNHKIGVSIYSPDGQNTVHEETDTTPGELDIRNPRSLPRDGEHSHVITGGDPETRPVNIALNYLIYTGIKK